MPYAYRNQPIKSIYLLSQFVALVLVRFPIWFIVNIPRATRPRKTWSLKRALMVNAVRQVMYMSAQAGTPIPMPDHTSIREGTGVRGVWVEPANDLVTGDLKEWAKKANVSSIRIPGYWTHKRGSSIETGFPAEPSEKVILQFHGGGYIRLSAHPKDPTAQIAKGYAKEIESIQRVFSLEYRLTSGVPFKVAHPFPTQLLDALAGYKYLTSVVGFAPENIILSGDSAGGNLAHALTRYLTENQGKAGLPGPPGGLILLSPWIDMGSTTESLAGGSATKFLSSDYIGQPGGDVSYAKAAFIGPHGPELLETNAYVSPASRHPGLVVDFKNFPPTFIVAGGAEVLYDSIVTLKERMMKDLGDKLRYYEAPDAVHDYLIFTWHEPERTETLREINLWLKSFKFNSTSL